MKIAVINGTEKQGVTYRLKELFLEPFRGYAEIEEYALPRDCPGFCVGCIQCITMGENACKDAAYVQRIEASLLQADLIVMTSPAYVFHATGAMKTLLDHFAYLWMPHRPAPELFGKRAVIITQCLGAGGKSAARDIKHSLTWWGISNVKVFTGKLLGGIVWEELPEKKRSALANRLRGLSKHCRSIHYEKPARTNWIVKIRFLACRMMQRSLHKRDPEYLDGKYWAEQGWLEKARPWKS